MEGTLETSNSSPFTLEKEAQKEKATSGSAHTAGWRPNREPYTPESLSRALVSPSLILLSVY